MKFSFNSKRLLIWLGLVNVVLIVLHLVFQYLFIETELSPFIKDAALRFNMDAEVSIPTWFAVMLLIITAQLLLFIGLKNWKKKREWQWFALSVIALYLSIDEASEIHEMLIDPMQNLFGITSGPLFFAWIIPVSAILIVLAIVFGRFYWKLDRTTKILLAVAVVLFVSGAIGFEMISGAYWQSQDFAYDFTYRILNACEEGLENFGIITAIYALSRRI